MSWYRLDPQLSKYEKVVSLMDAPNTESYLKNQAEFMLASSARLDGAYMYTAWIEETIVVLVNKDIFNSTPDEKKKGEFMYCSTHEQFHIDNIIASNMGAHDQYTATKDHLDMAKDPVHSDRIKMHFNKLTSREAKIGFATMARNDFLNNTQVEGNDINSFTAANGAARYWHIILSALQQH